MSGTDAPVRTERHRALVIWCQDWPVVAGARLLGEPADRPAAVFRANRVQTCNASARTEGIRQGMRRRDAQSRCPELLVLAADPDRDARLFEPVAATVEEIAPGIEVLRPGLVACSARGPSRYLGSEEAAAERIVDLVESLDVECRVGIADSLAVAVLAARRARIVPPGGSADFCAPLPIAELAREPAISPPERAELVDLLVRLGIRTVGGFAALPEEKVITRFGADGLLAHRLARGVAERGLSRRDVPDDLAVEQACDPPLDRVDTAAFLARALAERFHARLADAGLACTRLAISARTEKGKEFSRIWRCARPLTSAATADRVRWQLDGWLTAGRTLQRDATGALHDEEGTGPGAITLLRLEPVEALGAGLVQYGLWGSDGDDDQRAGWAFARVQGLLGPSAVLAPVRSGGRGPAERVTLVPWGEEKVPAADPDAPWPGALPAPSPTRLALDTLPPDEVAVRLQDAAGEEVQLTDRGLLSADPVLVAGRAVPPAAVLGWAGPWLLDERWWSVRLPDPAVPVTAAAVVGAPVRHGKKEYVPAPGDIGYRRPSRARRLISHQDGDDRRDARVTAEPPVAVPPGGDGAGSGSGSGAGAGSTEVAGPVTVVTAPALRRARMQVLTGDGEVLLLAAVTLGDGGTGWQLEGTYD
ncbi:Y-family DNA polymerase [Nakamurella alba]|uniref:Y-family DNA polymerase n=1 Tax=Nakamurella alba TaxID=2665158 RepID=UPI001E52B70E|nr:DNA polymerase Y family protein [Nakamurella alba]